MVNNTSLIIENLRRAIIENLRRAIIDGASRAYNPPDYAELCPECRDNGHMMFLCQEHIDQLASYDAHVLDLRATALRTVEMLYRMDAHDVNPVLIEAQCGLLEQHLLQYLPENLREPCRKEIALWRDRDAARKAG